MPLTHAFLPLDRPAVAKGLVAFITLVICLPVIVVIAASFGPNSWIEEFIDPAFQFIAVLPLVAGAITAWLSQRLPIASVLIVSILGAFMAAVVGYWSATSVGHLRSASQFFTYILVTSSWCFVGGICVVLFRRLQTRL